MGRNRTNKPYYIDLNDYSYSLNRNDFHSTTRYIHSVQVLPLDTSNEFRTTMHNRENSKKSTKNQTDSCLKIVENYLEYSTLHGLRYVGDYTKSFWERFIWLVTFIFAVVCALYLSISIYNKYSLASVIVNINTIPIPVQSIPFPAVTVCNMNIIRKSEPELISTQSKTTLLDDACEFNNPLFFSNVLSNDSTNWDVASILSKVSQPCDKMLAVCKWMQREFDCKHLFSSTITDEGLCCTFNQLPLEYILRNPEHIAKLNSSNGDKTNRYPIDDWNPERGYSSNASDDVYPYRSRGPGAHLGLALVLNTDINNYYCSSSSSAGFKVLLHNPAEMPIMNISAFLLQPGLVIRAIFKPIINDAALNLESADISKRKCYFVHERYLKYFRTYTNANCKMECFTNLTLQRCGCAMYFLPRNTTTKICGKLQEECINEVRDIMQNEKHASKEKKRCDCLAGCFQLNYEKSMSYGAFNVAFNVRKRLTKNVSQEYFVKNMVSFELYFVKTNYLKYTKRQTYGFSEFLSNTAGILGLFLGFGTLSVVEICYHFSLKWICRSYRFRRRN